MIFLNKLKQPKLLSCSFFSIFFLLHNSHAQTADSSVTFGSIIAASTCTLMINGGPGSSTATVALTAPLSAGFTYSEVGTALGTAQTVSIGFNSTGPLNRTQCAYLGDLNFSFGAGSNTVVAIGTTRAILKPPSDTLGVGIELSAGIPIKDYSTPTYNPVTKVSSQTGLGPGRSGSALMYFSVIPVKTFAAGTPIRGGSFSIDVPITLAYQ